MSWWPRTSARRMSGSRSARHCEKSLHPSPDTAPWFVEKVSTLLTQPHPPPTMARVSTWFHFAGNAEEAFNFYKSVFKTEFVGPIKRFSDLPAQPGQPPLSDKEAAKIMKIALPILGGHVIIGNDAPEFLGQRIQGNNVTLNLETDSRAETDRLFNAGRANGVRPSIVVFLA